MALLWDSVRNVTGVLGTTASIVSSKAKLKTDLFLVDREIQQRQHIFGMQLYDYVEPLSRNPNFFAADDVLTETIRPSLIVAQREIAALDIKRRKQTDRLSLAKANRASAFPIPANTWQEKLGNMGKSAVMTTGEVQLQTQLSFIDSEIKSHKHKFGVSLFLILENLEDTKGWLPTDREIRSIYDNCRRDVEKLRKKKTLKQEQLEEVDEIHGGAGGASMGMRSERGTSSTTGTYNTPGMSQQQPSPYGMQQQPPLPYGMQQPQQQPSPYGMQQPQQQPQAYGMQQPQQQPQAYAYPPNQQQQPQLPHATAVAPDNNMSLYGNNQKTIHSTIGDSNSSSMFVTNNTSIHDAVALAGAPSADAYPPPFKQQEPQQPQSYPDPFANPAATPTASYPDPFANTTNTPQSSHPDPFASAPPKQEQQINTNWMNQAKPFAHPGSSYDDPFAGLGTTTASGGKSKYGM